MIEVRHDRALYLPQADLWLDPRLPKPLAFVSHAHSDHTGRHEKTIATTTTLRLMQARMGEWDGEKIALPFGESRDFENFRLRLLPAGHVLGSAQAFLETDQGTLLYTGDFKLRQGASAETAAHCQAETLVMETTYGLPRYVFPPFEEVMAQILKFCIESLEENSVPVLLGYSLGKAQEILACLRGAGLPVMLHSTISKLVPIYREEGIEFPEFSEWNPAEAANHVVICPPTAAGSRAMAAVKKRRVAAITGWALDPGAIHRMRCDAAFPLSDHAGYDDLLRHVENVNPRRVLTLHGFASEFAADLRSRGIEAWALTGPNQLDLPLSSRAPASHQEGSVCQSRIDEAAKAAPALTSRTLLGFPSQSGFLQFCAVAERIATLTGKLAKIQILSDYFRPLGESELRLAALWLSGHAFPASDAAPHQAGRAVIRAALLQASGMTEAEYRPLSRGLNDSGLTTETVLADHGGNANPDLPEIAFLLSGLRAAKGPAAKSSLLETFFREVPPLASKFLVKILSGDLRIGLKEGLHEEALAAAFEGDPAAVREAHMLEGDLGQVAILARDQRLHESALRVFQPVKCMLSIPEPDAPAIIARFGEEALWVEPKFDGIRAQIHTDGTSAHIFSRDLKNVTATFPEIAQAACRLGREAVFDAEILAWQDGRPLPFFELQKRLGRTEPDLFLGAEIPVVAVIFDILHLDGTTLLRETLRRRRTHLDSLNLAEPLRCAKLLKAIGAIELDDLFNATRKRGHEGLMVKDPESLYSPGRRGGSWVKLKKRLATLDVVVTAVEYGHGKRRGVLSDYTFALRDESTNQLATLGKAYTGLTDAEIAELTDEFLGLVISKKGNRLEVEPRIVLEIAFDAIRKSPRHNSGLALRFPRIVRLRRDKTEADIDTLATARRLLPTAE
ncbi:MAG: ATP-dependent DNA ligase [Verrucomicrobia bacterium]|nr:ATP-dependent DNA ligase [Verrucomicrobiota bacterium]